VVGGIKRIKKKRRRKKFRSRRPKTPMYKNAGGLKEQTRQNGEKQSQRKNGIVGNVVQI